MHPFKLVRSKRKTLALIIEPDATLTIRAPHRLAMNRIVASIEERLSWIQEKILERKKTLGVVAQGFETGNQFLYLGKRYPLFIQEKTTMGLVFSDERFVLSSTLQKKAKQYFTHWYTIQATRIILERVSYWKERMHSQTEGVKISKAQTRWGSCTHDNKLFFSWRLVLAPLEIIDYVIVHELAHTKYKHHKATFWKHVSVYYPHFKTAKQWLAKYGPTLTLP